MITSTLYELKAEIERLYIAGIRGSKNNSHILKCIPVIEKHVKEDPAYANLASALKQIVNPLYKHDVEAFAEIYASLNYLLRLYGKPVAPDKERSEHTPVFIIDTITTTRSFLALNALITALTEPVKDGLELIRKAREDKLFDDFRTYPYLNIALDNKLISAEVEDIVKNEIGEKMIPFIVKGFHYSDEWGDLRRFSLLCGFQYAYIDQLLDRILKSTAVNLQAAAKKYVANKERIG